MSLTTFKLLAQDLIQLVYPQVCISCQNIKQRNSSVFCSTCYQLVSITDHFKLKDNDLLNRLSPRICPEFAAAYFDYIKEGLVQKAIHALKYSGRSDIGFKLGQSFGYAYSKLDSFKADLIIPIPIHPKRLKKRGYNQCEVFASGISKVCNIPIRSRHLLKLDHSKSLTTKSRSDRFESVLNSFVLKDSIALENKRILLVDDVLTTGATIEAAYTLLEKIPGIKIQIGIIALANN